MDKDIKINNLDKLISITNNENEDYLVHVTLYTNYISAMSDYDNITTNNSQDKNSDNKDTDNKHSLTEDYYVVAKKSSETSFKTSYIVEVLKITDAIPLDYSRSYLNANDILKYAQNNDLMGVVMTLQNGAYINLQNDVGYSALHYACDYNHDDIAKYLIRNGADVNLKDSESYTPLHVAVRENYFKIIKFLFVHGSNINEKTIGGRNVLHIASRFGNYNTVRYIIEHHNSEIDINDRDNDGMTALHWACMSCHLDVLEYLALNEAVIDIKDNDGMTALHWAVINGYLDIVKYLVYAGALIDDVVAGGKYKGNNSLQLAVLNNREDVANYLKLVKANQ